MNSQRLWPAFQTFGKTLIYNRSSDLLQHGVKAYNSQNFSFTITGNCASSSAFPDEKCSISYHLQKTLKGSYIKTVSHRFSNGQSVHFSNEFKNEENEFAHNILQSLPAYKSTTISDCPINIPNNTDNASPFILKNKNWSVCTIDELVEVFSHISGDSKLINTFNYISLCDTIVKRIRELSDDHILKLLSTMVKWKFPISSSLKLLNALEKSCSYRVKQWAIPHAFLVADYWYKLKNYTVKSYFMVLVTTFGHQISYMSPSQIVQFMFFVNINRSFGPIKFSLLEGKILDYINSISIHELSIIMMGFFKTETNINSPLVKAIINKTIENLENISSPALGAILKVLRKSVAPEDSDKIVYFLEELCSHLHKFNFLCLLQASLLGNNLLIFHPRSINIIAEKFGKEINSIRLKDIERFTFVLMLYNYLPPSCPNILDLILTELRNPNRISEINHYPKSFVSCVVYLTVIGLFPLDLISATFQPSMIKLIRESGASHYLGRELSELNWTLRIEVPSTYKGYRLDDEFSKFLTKENLGRVPNRSMKHLSYQDSFTLDVMEKLSRVLGESAHSTIILPHFQNPDVVFCTDGNGKAVPVPSEFLNIPSYELSLPLNTENLLWNVVIIGGRNSFLRYSANLRGNFEMKRRQLKLLGYNVILVPHMIYQMKGVKGKIAWLESLLQDILFKKQDRNENYSLKNPSVEET